MLSFLHTYLPERVLVTLGPISIHWYGLMIAIGAACGIAVMVRIARRYGIAADTIYDYALWVIVASLVAERLYYVLYAWGYYSSHLLEIPQIWKGGLAIHGAFIAGPLVTYFFARRRGLRVWQLLDVAVVGLALGQAIGRWGNYFNQELFGTPTALPWGIPIAPENRPSQYATSEFFHPTFLYESIWNLGVCGALFLMHRLRKNKKSPLAEGNITLIYFILYSMGRFGTEFLRTDYTPYILGIRWAQFVSAAIIVTAGAVLGVRVWRRRSRRGLGGAGKQV